MTCPIGAPRRRAALKGKTSFLYRPIGRFGDFRELISVDWLKEAVMEERRLRVLKWLGTVPAVGTCTLCGCEFKVPVTALKSVADAQEILRAQFAEHECKPEDGS